MCPMLDTNQKKYRGGRLSDKIKQNGDNSIIVTENHLRQQQVSIALQKMPSVLHSKSSSSSRSGVTSQPPLAAPFPSQSQLRSAAYGTNGR
jgi:hypothetical protein